MNIFKDKDLFDLQNVISTNTKDILNKNLVPTDFVNNNKGNSSLLIKYNEINNRSSESSNSSFLNGVYVTKNSNPLPLSMLNTTNFVCSRYSSSIKNGIIYQDIKVSFKTYMFISFWIYPIYSSQNLKPMSIITKSDSNSYGDYTIQLGTDNRLLFGYTVNGLNVVLKTNSVINEKTLTFVAIIKNMSSLYIYINNIYDSQVYAPIDPVQTNNPLMIGIGYNTNDFNGYIDNLTISDNITDLTNIISFFFKCKPIDYFLTFKNGIITFNGYNHSNNINIVEPKSIFDAKFLCELLENYCNGFCNNNNKYLFFNDNQYNDTIVNNSIIYEKTNVMSVANIDFVSIKISLEKEKNVSLSQTYLLNGYYKSFTEETYYFANGELFQYNTSLNSYTPVPLDISSSINLLFIINDVNVVEYVNNKFIYYSSYLINNSNSITNTVLRKKPDCTFGQNNSFINFYGHTNIGSYIFTRETNSTPFRNLDNQEDITSNITDNKSNIPYIKVLNNDLATNTVSNNTNVITSYLYAYDTNNLNISGLLNVPGDFFINTMPKITNKIQIDFNLMEEFDIVDFMLRNHISVGRLVIANFSKPLLSGIYNFSIITSSIIKIKIANKEYSVNSMIPQHILFHNTTEICNIELTFYYQKINQVCKFVVIE
jgi:hypothetical protein